MIINLLYSLIIFYFLVIIPLPRLYEDGVAVSDDISPGGGA